MRPPVHLHRKLRPILEYPSDARFNFMGTVGVRIQKNIDNWLIPMPESNPGVLEMYRDKDRLPRRYIMPWAGEFPGKYLTSASLTLRMTSDQRLQKAIGEFVKEFIQLQDEDGYLGPHPRDIRFVGRGMWNDRELWDVWGHYHCILGLLLWYQETGDESALLASRKAADLIIREFKEARRPLSGLIAQEMDMAIIHAYTLLFEITGEEKYLEMAHFIKEDWQTPKAGDYLRLALSGEAFYEMPRHRWESLHDIQALTELHLITADEDYRKALERIWWSILEGDRHNTGAFSTNEGAVGNPYQGGPIETCCTVAWIALSMDMLRITGDSRIADEIELSTLNAMLGAQHASGRWWTYDTPSDGIRKASAHEIVFHSAPGTSELNCCAVNGPRSLGMLSQWAVMESQDGVVVNYYGPSEIQLRLPTGNLLQMKQQTDYPITGEVEVVMELNHSEIFSLQLRIPVWSKNTNVQVNGEMINAVECGTYLCLNREWEDGSIIRISFDTSPHFWIGEREASGKASIYRGPILLAYDRQYNAFDPDSLPKLDLMQMELELTKTSSWIQPWMLFKIPLDDGSSLFLCDFASAGTAATPYRTWLPIQELVASSYSGDQFRWHARIPPRDDDNTTRV